MTAGRRSYSLDGSSAVGRKTTPELLARPAETRPGGSMEKTQLNPWSWQDQYGYSQGWRVDQAQSVVFIAGQIALSPDGQLVGEGDFEAQCRQVFENIAPGREKAGGAFDPRMRGE